MITATTLYYLFAILFSLCIGSFLNVVIYRLPKMLYQQQCKDCRVLLKLPLLKEKPLNLCLPRSFCPHCQTKIKAWHNIPLLGFFLLKRRCSKCKKPISWSYPIIELLTCLLTLFHFWYFGFTEQAFFALGFVYFLIPLFCIDLKEQLLPDVLTLSLLWLGLVANSLSLFTSLHDAVLSSLCAYLFLWIFIHLYYLLTKKVGMGHGDFKLFAALGAWFGWFFLPFILFFSCLIAAIIGLIYLKMQQKPTDTPIPFGPFLCVSGILTLYAKPLIMLIF